MPRDATPPAGRCVIVHGAPDVRLACAPGLPVTLLSAPGAAGMLGALWWATLARDARLAAPRLPIADMLDCGDAPGRVLEALRCGLTLLILSPCPAFSPLAELVAEQGGRLLDRAPPSLDLANAHAKPRLIEWLATAIDDRIHQ